MFKGIYNDRDESKHPNKKTKHIGQHDQQALWYSKESNQTAKTLKDDSNKKRFLIIKTLIKPVPSTALDTI